MGSSNSGQAPGRMLGERNDSRLGKRQEAVWCGGTLGETGWGWPDIPLCSGDTSLSCRLSTVRVKFRPPSLLSAVCL